MWREVKFWVSNKFYDWWSTHHTQASDNFCDIFLDGWYIFTPPLKQTMMAIDGLSCRFFICLYDLNTFCFFSSWFRDVVGTHFLDVYARPLAAEKILINFKTKSLEIKRYWEYARRCKSDGNQIPHHDDVIMKVEEANIPKLKLKNCPKLLLLDEKSVPFLICETLLHLLTSSGGSSLVGC